MTENENLGTELSAPDCMTEYRKISFKVGLFVSVSFVLRAVAGGAISAFLALFGDKLSETALYIGRLMLSALFLQILPSIIAAGMFGFFRNGCAKLKSVYRVPKRCAKAIGNFTAVYGLGQLVNIITIVISFFIASGSDLNDSFNTMSSIQPPNMASAWYLLFTLAVIAPVFEEFIFRGALMDALKPYGNGLSIFATGILFGLYHGNFSQCFYAAAIGIALGYIANVTNSIFATTIIHAIFNSISGILLLLMTTPAVQDYVLSGGSEEIPDSEMFLVVFFGIFVVCALLLMFIGAIQAVMKIKQIRRYKVPKVWGEVSNGKKVRILLFSVPSLIALLLIIDAFTGVSSELLSKLFYN